MTYARLKWLTILWITAIVVGSLAPGDLKIALGTETKSRSPVVQQRTSVQHQFGHYVAFGIGAVLLVGVAHTRTRRYAYCLGLIALGCLLECLQYAITLAHPDPDNPQVPRLETWDMRDDAIAVALGCLIAGALHFGESARKEAGLSGGRLQMDRT